MLATKMKHARAVCARCFAPFAKYVVCVQTWLRTLSKASRMLDSLIGFTLNDFGQFFDQGAQLKTAFEKGNGERFEEFSMFLTTFS